MHHLQVISSAATQHPSALHNSSQALLDLFSSSGLPPMNSLGLLKLLVATMVQASPDGKCRAAHQLRRCSCAAGCLTWNHAATALAMYSCTELTMYLPAVYDPADTALA
jgi:hypothetical protein